MVARRRVEGKTDREIRRCITRQLTAPSPRNEPEHRSRTSPHGQEEAFQAILTQIEASRPIFSVARQLSP
jgi:hypothetical protein